MTLGECITYLLCNCFKVCVSKNCLCYVRWINDENPLEKASKIAKTNLFQTPIDEIDAAARILDPIFVGVNADKDMFDGERSIKEYGKFYKDYKETEW